MVNGTVTDLFCRTICSGIGLMDGGNAVGVGVGVGLPGGGGAGAAANGTNERPTMEPVAPSVFAGWRLSEASAPVVVLNWNVPRFRLSPLAVVTSVPDASNTEMVEPAPPVAHGH